MSDQVKKPDQEDQELYGWKVYQVAGRRTCLWFRTTLMLPLSLDMHDPPSSSFPDHWRVVRGERGECQRFRNL